MPDNLTALVKTAQSPALARVSNQLALTDKLLTKPEESFLIPYRKGNKWVFCDRNDNVVIDWVYDYPRFSDENISFKWYVHSRDDDWRGDWENKGFVTDGLVADVDHSTDSDSFVVLKVNPSKDTLTLVFATDTIARRIVINGREIIIIGCHTEANLYWTRKPSDIIINIGDKIETKAGADLFNEIERD